MTTREKQPGTERALPSTSASGLNVRLWVGQNPLLFVALCVMSGYWFGRGVSRGERS